MGLFTLSGLATWDEEIRRSRFLTVADSVQNPAQALAFIDAHSVPDATHNCWAYQVGDEYRFNDDGEPGGTAGKPILQAIQGQQCDQVVVLVVRWFGGIKLGTGGLIRAYGGCAAQCLRQASKTPIVDVAQALCYCPFSDMALVQSRFPDHQVTVLQERFDDTGVVWTLTIPTQDQNGFIEHFTNLTRGQGRVDILDKPDSARASR